jgi:hypothetical protein
LNNENGFKKFISVINRHKQPETTVNETDKRSITSLKELIKIQCCGSRSGIQCFFDPRIRDEKNPDAGYEIRDKHPGSYFRELR